MMVEDVWGVRAFSNFRKAAVKQFTFLKVLVNLKKAIKGSPAYRISQKDGVRRNPVFSSFLSGIVYRYSKDT
jgi:hypothetical protein